MIFHESPGNATLLIMLVYNFMVTISGSLTASMQGSCPIFSRCRCNSLENRVMMTSSNGNIFRVTDHLCGEFTGPRWIPRTKASDALMFSLISVWINGWVNNRETGDLRRYRVHYDVTVMYPILNELQRLAYMAGNQDNSDLAIAAWQHVRPIFVLQ